MHRPDRFDKFYFAKVGLGEACGCAERIIDVHEFNRLAGPRKTSLGSKTSVFRRFWARLKRAG